MKKKHTHTQHILAVNYRLVPWKMFGPNVPPLPPYNNTVGHGLFLQIHSEADDRRREKQALLDAGGVDALVVMPPAIEIKRKWLVTTVTKAEYMPVMDHNLLGGAAGGDFFFEAWVACVCPCVCVSCVCVFVSAVCLCICV